MDDKSDDGLCKELGDKSIRESKEMEARFWADVKATEKRRRAHLTPGPKTTPG